RAHGPPIHLPHAWSFQDLSGQPQGAREHQPVVLSGRQDRRARPQRRRQIDASAHHGGPRHRNRPRGPCGRGGRRTPRLPRGAAPVGFLPQEPQLDPDKSVRENVMEGVAPQKAILERYNELAMNYSEETADEMTRLQDEIEAKGLWDLDSKVDQAMDALRCPPD